MNIEEYYQTEGSMLSFTRQQASDFAKNVAGDFNPIHDIDSKRFCVPGDLLFSVIIHHYGLRQNMIFNFSGMVGDHVKLILPEPDNDSEHLALMDEKGNSTLHYAAGGGFIDLVQAIYRGHTEFAKFLMDEGAEINAKDLKGHSILNSAIYYDRKEIIEILKKEWAKE